VSTARENLPEGETRRETGASRDRATPGTGNVKTDAAELGDLPLAFLVAGEAREEIFKVVQVRNPRRSPPSWPRLNRLT